MNDDFGRPHFDGPDYEPENDWTRLKKQVDRIREFMLAIFPGWRTLQEIHAATGDPESSISAQLRHLRKKRFGGYEVEKRPRGNRKLGFYEYRVSLPKGQVDLPFEDSKK